MPYFYIYFTWPWMQRPENKLQPTENCCNNQGSFPEQSWVAALCASWGFWIPFPISSGGILEEENIHLCKGNLCWEEEFISLFYLFLSSIIYSGQRIKTVGFWQCLMFYINSIGKSLWQQTLTLPEYLHSTYCYFTRSIFFFFRKIDIETKYCSSTANLSAEEEVDNLTVFQSKALKDTPSSLEHENCTHLAVFSPALGKSDRFTCLNYRLSSTLTHHPSTPAHRLDFTPGKTTTQELFPLDLLVGKV